MVSRRSFLASTTVIGAATASHLPALAQVVAPAPTPLDPLTQPRFVNALVNPLAPAYTWTPTTVSTGAVRATFNLRIQAFTAQLGLRNPANGRPLGTRLWGYASGGQAPTFPARSFQVATGTRIQVSYNNALVDNRGRPLPNPMPVDTTIEWANPGNLGALAPVPLVAHLHGSDSQYLSDGLPDAWETPGAVLRGALWSKPYTYDNAQEAGHLWYHDHALGITRTNVYMGLAGNYFIRGADEVRLAATRSLPTFPYEVPLVIQDRMFLSDGSLFYPSDPGLYPFDPGTGFPPAQTPPVTHLPEFFGDHILVNGAPWPNLDVEPRQYRLRVLNGSDSRVYDLRIETGTVPGAGAQAPMWVIGNELGLLNAPAPVSVLSIAPGERYDVIVDFTGRAGQSFVMTNSANAPFPNGDPVVAGVTDQVMRFRVNRPLNRTRPVTTLPANLRPVSGALPVPNPASATRTRRILLVEGTDPLGRLMTMLGPVDPVASAGGPVQGTLFYRDPVTENPAVGATEIWEFYNATVDAHPIHMHLVDFRILNRQDFDSAVVSAKDMGGGYVGGLLDPAQIAFTGPVITPNAAEAGKKDTAIMYPGQVTRVMATFKRPGSYVYHCHILSHEDHEMMRPYRVGP